VRDLDPLAAAGEQHGVVADDVAAAQRAKPMLPPRRAPVSPCARGPRRPRAWCRGPAATTSPICSAVPLGASTLRRWWVSTISMS
jgi:hypothetical protein